MLTPSVRGTERTRVLARSLAHSHVLVVADASGSIVVNKTDAASHKVFVTLPAVEPVCTTLYHSLARIETILTMAAAAVLWSSQRRERRRRSSRYPPERRP